jgi:oxalate decarboxylase/phosphoglucose isomerase-like protein (cupin superfamily)
LWKVGDMFWKAATALVPRGRCHYFVNESGGPMAMVWVYAGPVPERVVLPECCCRPA